MISLKKVFVAAAVATLSFGLFAQSEPKSKTNTATAGLFGTDVDTYTSVNYWSEVKPENFFAYFGMSKTPQANLSTYDFGFAKQFSKCYWGTYFSGNLGSYSETKTSGNGKSSTEKTNGKSEFTFNNTFGFGNIGLALDFYYYEDGTSGTTFTPATLPDAKDITTTTDAATWNLGLKAGLREYKVKNTALAPYAKFNYIMNPADIKIEDTSIHGSKVTKTNEDTVDSRWTVVALTAGADIFLGKSETTEKTANVEAMFAFVNPKDSDKKYKVTEITVPVSYTAIFNASEALKFGFNAKAESKFDFGKGDDNDDFLFGFAPEFNVGVTYETKKKVDLNAGVGFAVPSFSYSKNTANDVTSETSKWDGKDATLSYNSGFAINPTKNITIDCSYEILQNIFSDTSTSTDLNTGDKNFWNTVNDTFVHNIGFEVTVKF